MSQVTTLPLLRLGAEGVVPPLALISRRPLDAETMQLLRDMIRNAAENRLPIIVDSSDFEVFQVIDGRWERLDGGP